MLVTTSVEFCVFQPVFRCCLCFNQIWNQQRSCCSVSELLLKPTSTLQAGNVVSNSLQVHQLERRCACCACEYKCKKEIYLWISPGIVQTTQILRDLRLERHFLSSFVKEDMQRGGTVGCGSGAIQSRPEPGAGMSKVEYSLVWPSISARSSFQSSSGILKKTSTTAGSNCVPEQRRISVRAASKLLALR